MNHFHEICTLGLVLLFTSCSSTPQVKSEPPVQKLSPAEPGALVSTTGEAVTEIDLPPDPAFDLIEVFFRKNLKVTFVNHSQHKLEAEDKKMQYTVELIALTTGKTELSVTVTNRAEKRPDPTAARDLSDRILEYIKTSAKKGPVTQFKK